MGVATRVMIMTADLSDLVLEFRTHGQAIRWPVANGLESSTAVAYRNDFAQVLSEKNVPDILASYVYLSASEMEEMVSLVTRNLLVRPLTGFGLELGAGCGLLSSVVAKLPEVRAVLAVEVCQEMVERVIPKVAAWILGAEASKVAPVAGSFDDLQLEDESV